MLEDVVVIGLVMALTGLVKAAAKRLGMSDEAIKQIVTPLSVLALAGALNVAQAAVFQPELDWREALKQGLTLGAIAGGIYGLGKAALGMS